MSTLTATYTDGQGNSASDVADLLIVSPPPSSIPWFEENWEAYENNSDIINTPGYTTTGSSQGQVTVETALTGTPWGGDHGIRVALKAGSCNGQPETGVRILEIPGSALERPREIFWEVYAKWSANYETDWGCASGREHKWLPHFENAGSRRWRTDIGSGGGRQMRSDGSWRDGESVTWKIPPNTGTAVDSRTDLWDEAWHQVRGHFKMGEGDGIVEGWLDGVKAFDETGLTTGSGSNYFKRVYFSSNHNAKPAEVIDVLFGRYRIHITDPGW